MQIISYIFVFLKHIQVNSLFWKLLMLKVWLYFLGGQSVQCLIFYCVLFIGYYVRRDPAISACYYTSFVQIINIHELFWNALRCQILVPAEYWWPYRSSFSVILDIIWLSSKTGFFSSSSYFCLCRMNHMMSSDEENPHMHPNVDMDHAPMVKLSSVY